MYMPALELSSFDDPNLPVGNKLEILRGLLEFLILNNRIWLRKNRIKSLYDYAPSYKLKVRPFGLDTWQDIPRTVSLGSGDCKDFACWRVAELREAGVPDVSCRIKTGQADGITVYHIQVRCDLKVEDPSAILGMPPQLSGAQAKSLVRGSGGVGGILEAQRAGDLLNQNFTAEKR